MQSVEVTEKKPLILIVDDSIVNLQILESLLTLKEYRVSSTSDSSKAFQMAKELLPDLIFLDIMMPGLDGYSVIELLSSDIITRDIPVIFITAKTETSDIIQAFKYGAVDYIKKPFNGEELFARVKTHIELKQARKKLELLNAEKDKFFSLIAHDLRNPFTILLNISQLLLEQYDLFDDTKRKDYIKLIMDSSKRTYQLLDNLLRWARSQSGHIQLEKSNFSLNELIEENIKLNEGLAKNKNLNIIFEEEKKYSIFADRNTINTVIRNILVNAIKFTPENGSVIFSIDPQDNYAILSIKDSGVGIPKVRIEKLFKLGEFVKTKGTNNEAGTGLGLMICKDFIEKNGGKLWVESIEGEGSIFSFSVLLADTSEH